MGKKKDNEREEEVAAQIIKGEIEATQEIDQEFLEDFIVETKEHVENIEMHLLALETEPENTEIIHSLFREFHTIKGLAGFVNIDLVRKVAHQTETQLDECRKGNIKINKALIDVILTSSDYIKQVIENLNTINDPNFLNSVEAHLEILKNKIIPESPGEVKIGEVLIAQGMKKNVVDELLTKQADYPELKLGQVAVKEKKVEVREVITSLRILETAKSKAEISYTRVPTTKIENLVDLMGELIIIQSLIEREATRRFGTNDSFITNLLRMEKITKDIQYISMSLRMVSLKSTFQKIYRIARDSINELNKNVSLLIQGEDTEIDRGITEKILDPLLHLVKNAISHGIESEEERLSKGKTGEGQVKISAYSKRGTVYIEVSDDGHGLNFEKIRQKAVEKGIVDPSQDYSDEDLINLIYRPGFSTAESVDSVSGRGVGLDVVKTVMGKIGGKVEVNNRPGEGCAFTLKIPINLAAINGTVVDIMGENYIIPTLFIKQIIKPEEHQWISVTGNKAMIRVKDQVIPVVSISKVFGLKDGGQKDEGDLVVIIELEQMLKAIRVRSIVERREIVVKTLGHEFSYLDYASGASILGNGRVTLILDVENLFKIGEAV